MNRVSAKMKEAETYNYQMRQKILRDMEAVKVKEDEVLRIKTLIEERERKDNS